MSPRPVAAIQLDRRPVPAGVSPRRLSMIARNRLQELGVPAFIVGDLVRGRLLVDPSRFLPWPGVTIEAKQELVVQGHDRFWFTAPSVLRFIGPIHFYDARGLEDVHREAQARWADLRTKSIEFLETARRYFPSIELDVHTWTLDVAVADPFGVVNLRVRPHQGHVWVEVVGTDGKAIAPRAADDRLLMALPQDPAMFDEHTLAPLLHRVRAGATPTANEAEPMVLELEIESTNELSPEPAPSQAGDSLSLDLDLLLTGDVPKSPPDLELPTLEAVELADEEDDEPLVPMAARAPRLKTCALEVYVSTATFTARGVVRDANQGGLFIEVEDPERFSLGHVVVVSGIGPFAARARVAHRRDVHEGALLGTGGGIGISFSDPPVPRIVAGPAPVVILTDTSTGPERRGRFAAIISSARCTPIVADTLPECLVAARTLPVRAVVLDQTFSDYDWREIADAFRFWQIGAELLVVTQEATGKFADGVRAVAPERLASTLFAPG